MAILSRSPQTATSQADACLIVAVLTLLPQIVTCLRAFHVPEQDLDDLTNSTLLAALSHLHQFDPARGTLAAWLLEIARNEARKARARARRELVGVELDDGAAAPEDESPFERMRARDIHELVEQMLASLLAVARIRGFPVKRSGEGIR